MKTSGLNLGYGPFSVDLAKRISATKKEDVRPCDLEELYDSLKSIGYREWEINKDFGQLLSLSLGSMRPKVRVYGIFEDQDPLFLATLSQEMDCGVGILCGYGLKSVHTKLSKRQQYDALIHLFDLVLKEMIHRFKLRYALCNVKDTNTETLKMWRFIKKRFEHNRHGTVNITDNPFQAGYRLVTITIERYE